MVNVDTKQLIQSLGDWIGHDEAQHVGDIIWALARDERLCDDFNRVVRSERRSLMAEMEAVHDEH